MTAIAKLEEYVDKTIDVFIETMSAQFVDKKSSDGGVDLVQWIQYFAFDVLGQLLYGRRHGFIETGNDVDDIIKIADFGSFYNLIVSDPSRDSFSFAVADCGQ